MLQSQLQDDLKAARLAGDKVRLETLQMLKSVILNYEIAGGLRQQGVSDEQFIALCSKEVKKRLEAAELYDKAGNQVRAAAERGEAELLTTYLPTQLSDEALSAAVETVLDALQPAGPKDIGKVIAAVKAKVGNQADGARIAQLVKQKLT